MHPPHPPLNPPLANPRWGDASPLQFKYCTPESRECPFPEKHHVRTIHFENHKIGLVNHRKYYYNIQSSRERILYKCSFLFFFSSGKSRLNSVLRDCRCCVIDVFKRSSSSSSSLSALDKFLNIANWRDFRVSLFDASFAILRKRIQTVVELDDVCILSLKLRVEAIQFF